MENMKSFYARRTSGFTLVEIVVTIVIIGALASLAYVGYTKVILRQNERDGILKLKAIQNLLNMYHAKYGQYPDCASCSSEEDIQNAIGMYIQHDPFDISCHLYTDHYVCYASYPIVAGTQWDDRLFMLRIDSDHDDMVSCQVTGHCGACECPTCKTSDSGGCPAL